VAELLEGRCALASTGIQTLRSRGGVEAVAVNLQHFAVVHGEPLPFDPFTSENLWGEVEAYLEQVFSQVELPALGATRPAFWETLAETERANESGTQEPVLSVILDDVVEIGEIWSCYEILNDLVTIPWELLIAGNDAQVPGLGDVRVRVLPTSESRERWQAFNAALDLAAGHYLTRWNRLWQACPTALCRAVWRLEQAPEVAAVAVVPSLRGKAASASGSAFVWRRSPHRVAGPDVAAVEYTLCCQLARTGGALEVQFAEDG
jgi:hypothetical protein